MGGRRLPSVLAIVGRSLVQHGKARRLQVLAAPLSAGPAAACHYGGLLPLAGVPGALPIAADPEPVRLHDRDRVVRELRVPVLRSALPRSEEHTSELQSLMRISYAVFCLKKKNK